MTSTAFLVAVTTASLLFSETASAFSASNNDAPAVPMPPWYSDPSILRDRSHVIPPDRGFDYRPTNKDNDDCGDLDRIGLSSTVIGILKQRTTRIIPFVGNEVYVRQLTSQEGEESDTKDRKNVAPLCLLYDDFEPSLFCGDDEHEEGATISWLGQERSSSIDGRDYDDGTSGEDERIMDYFAVDIPRHKTERFLSSISVDNDETTIEASTVRNYGDRMPSRMNAALIASANGLLTFHRTHRFCSMCGSPSRQTKAGSARRCTNDECRTSVYPRIDPAVIMLITSPCGEYALLGRKKSWPAGRYSTLAGFAEVGETLEECVVRETLEESGVAVDSESIQFVASQPWPFPRSMMVGFTGKAVACDADDDIMDDNISLPNITVDPIELDNAKWFSKEYIRTNGLVEGRGSSALDFEPDDEEAEFHVPGPASLARLLITKWANI